VPPIRAAPMTSPAPTAPRHPPDRDVGYRTKGRRRRRRRVRTNSTGRSTSAHGSRRLPPTATVAPAAAGGVREEGWPGHETRGAAAGLTTDGAEHAHTHALTRANGLNLLQSRPYPYFKSSKYHPSQSTPSAQCPNPPQPEVTTEDDMRLTRRSTTIAPQPIPTRLCRQPNPSQPVL